MSKAKSAHYTKIIAEHSGDHRSLWKAFIKFLHRCPKMHLPGHSSIYAIANTFSSFFINKVSNSHYYFCSGSCSSVLNPLDTRKVLQNLTCVTNDYVGRVVLSVLCKSEDYWNSSNTDSSISQVNALWRIFPFTLQGCPSLPSIEKPTLSKNNMNNYRPVSNLSFLSKVLEKVVVNQLNSHIKSSNTSSQYQSAYSKFHSTETALLKIHNDILASMDAVKVTTLTLIFLMKKLLLAL